MLGVNSQLNTHPEPMSNGHSMNECVPAFTVRFWGVRRTIPISSSLTAHYGGNTSCVELSVAGKCLIFDGGTGLHLLGEHLCDRTPMEAHLFFTNTQFDRIQGFPFFQPAFQTGNQFYIYGPQASNGATIKHALTEQMLRPKSLVPFHKMKADVKFQTLSPGSRLTLDDITIETLTLNSINSALGYRITWQGYTVVYATDIYCTPTSQGLHHLARKADLLIFDAINSGSAYFDPKQAEHLKRFSTWKQSIHSTLEVGIKQAVMFCHDPNHMDVFLGQVEAEMQALYPNVSMAREGKVVAVGSIYPSP